MGVPTRDSCLRRILKACNLGRVEAQYLKPKIVFSRSTNTSPVLVLTNHPSLAYMNTDSCNDVFRFEYYSSRVITHDSARYLYPSNSRIPSFFRVAKQGRVIRRNFVNIPVKFGSFESGACPQINLLLYR